MARAPPCEKPANIVLMDDTLDDEISSSMISCSLSTARIMLISSSILFSSNDAKSNHADVGKPLFNVNGIFLLERLLLLAKYSITFSLKPILILIENQYYSRTVKKKLPCMALQKFS